jgi:chemotaxis protein MotB
MSKSRRRHEEHEEHVNHERWLVSYADMMTLLMVLFIVMFAISQVDQRRFDQLKDGMAAGFGATASPFEGSQSVMDGQGAQAFEQASPDLSSPQPQSQTQSQAQSQAQAGARPQPQDIGVQTSAARRAVETEQQADALTTARHEVNRLQRIERRIERVLASKGLLHDVSIKIDERGLAISMVSRHIVFAANLAELTPRGREVLQVLSPVIRSLPNRIEVDGHTNQVKVKPKYYPTDWELSAARAVNVLRYLNEHGRVPASRMTAVAYGHERPLRDPALPGAAALNKRVDLIVVSTAPERSRKLFAQVLRDRSNGHDGGPAT